MNNEIRERIIEIIPWSEAKDGVFLGDTYCADEDDLFDELNDHDLKDRPTKGVAARRINYRPRNIYDDFMDHLYDQGPEGITDDLPVSIKIACDNLQKAIEDAGIHWFEPIDYKRRVVYVILPEVTP